MPRTDPVPRLLSLSPITGKPKAKIMQASKRIRSRKACEPCRERKRKCDGGDPCSTCSEWDYHCYYKARQRKTQIDQHQTPDSGGERRQGATPSCTVPASAPIEPVQDHDGLALRVEANSGTAFVRKLGLRIDPARAPKLNLFGWNIGARQFSSPVGAAALLTISEITSLEHITALAQVYFDKVDPCYGFIDRDLFFRRLDTRWQSPQSPSVYDSVIGGVAALGCLFSQRNANITELHLARTARSSLDIHHLDGPPSIDVVTGWAVRTVYLRLTDTPHSTWIASCTLMHLVEASGLYSSSNVLPPSIECDPDIAKRLIGIAHHLNVWTSFDLGLSRVSFQTNGLPSLPAPRPGDYTAELLGLLPVSFSLDPDKSKGEVDLASTISSLLDRTHTQPPSVMAQCNLVICILRRIHVQNLDISPTLAERILTLLKTGLGCARSMVMDCAPWHQVANVPFQIICVLLVMDTRPSLAMLPDALQTLRFITETYDTDTMREACSTAELLVLLHQQRRNDDIAIFDQALGIQNQGTQVPAAFHPGPSAEEYSWLGALVADLPGLQRVDIDQFLNTDVMDDSSLVG